MRKETSLSDEDEKGYRGWLSKNGQVPGLGEIDKNWNGRHYDLRGVYKKLGPVDLKDAKIPDEFKKEGESQNPMDWKKGPGESMPWQQGGVGLTQTQDAPWATQNANPGSMVREA